eukprot:UN2312
MQPHIPPTMGSSGLNSRVKAVPPIMLLKLDSQEQKPRLMQPHIPPTMGSSGLNSRVKATFGVGSCNAAEREQILRSLRAISEGKGISDSVCHAAVPGDACHRATTYAMTIGFAHHPELYMGLKKTSSFEDFQMHLYKIGHADCPRPCIPPSGSGSTTGLALNRRWSLTCPPCRALAP